MCGIIFQENVHDKVLKDQKFIEDHKEIKESRETETHAARIYSGVLECLTYGRKFLDIGFGTGQVMQYFVDRGWVSFGMDSNKDIKETDRIFQDDFELTNKLGREQYDLVWMSFILEKFHNPILALKKAYDILQEDGVIYISTPDIDFHFSKPTDQWTHWNMKENYIMWSEKALCAELEKIGFNIIIKRRNFNKAFGYYFDLQIIAQKVYF